MEEDRLQAWRERFSEGSLTDSEMGVFKFVLRQNMAGGSTCRQQVGVKELIDRMWWRSVLLMRPAHPC